MQFLSSKPPAFQAAKRRDADFESTDGRYIVEVKLGAQGVRDLHGAMMHLALLLEQDKHIERAFLVIRFGRLTFARAREAWTRARHLLRQEIASRIGLVLLAPGRTDPWLDPPDAVTGNIAPELLAMIGGPTEQRLRGGAARPESRKFFEFWKVLLLGWLRDEGPYRLQQLAELAGCSHQTAMLSMALLERRSELAHGRDTRRVELRGFPRATFNQAVGLAATLRQTRWFVDRSGRSPDPAALLRRLEKRRSTHVAVGGVVAARVLDPSFDLHGLPRLDVTVWAPDRRPFDAGFVTDMDPGLRESNEKDGAVMAVHRLTRAHSLFDSRVDGPPYADPVEVLLDLHELGLAAQANDLLQTFRNRTERA